MKQFLFVLFILMQAHAIARDVEVTREMCDQLVTEHTPDADVAYKPQDDSNFGPPADLGGAIVIKPPKTIKIPIKFDIAKYMGVPEKQTVQNHAVLNNNLTGLKSASDQLAAKEAAVRDNRSALQAANLTVAQELAKPVVDPVALENAFTRAALESQVALSTLSQNYQGVLQSSKSLNENYTLLQKQFNPYEKDPIIKEQNRTLRDGTQAALADNLNHINTNTLQAKSLTDDIQKTLDLFGQAPSDFRSGAQFTPDISLGDALFAAQKQAGQVNQIYDGLATTEQKSLNDLGTKVAALDNPSNAYVDYAELGNVEMREDGRLYFNGQPLFNEDEFAIKQACRKLKGS